MMAVILLTIRAYAQEGMVIDLSSSSPALHFPIGIDGKKVRVVPAFEDYAFMLEDVCTAMKLTGDDCMIYPMNAKLGGNAIATIEDGNRIIVYDRELSPEIGYEGAMAVIGHELGHHYCGHIGTPVDPKQELEADRFAGASMKNAGMSLSNALAMATIFDERPSRSHPAKDGRIQAIKDGWNEPEEAKSCRGASGQSSQ
ncbi:hypothetical protein AAAK29_31195 [Mesorhizobium sp. CCNWLW179-1]|uniref:hypothetical protein n=1 Tax=unclassified Mesorhizobium TaxID=325217 RepID=UPI003014FC80